MAPQTVQDMRLSATIGTRSKAPRRHDHGKQNDGGRQAEGGGDRCWLHRQR